MAWPISQDYNEAIQQPASCFSDPELRQSQPVISALGLPQPCSGGFADVYELRNGSRSWAVKCFTRETPHLQERYAQISAHLRQSHLSFMVGFEFLAQGIHVGGRWLPIVKMEWVEGLALNAFVRGRLDKPTHLDILATAWVRLAQRLREVDVGHCDLQHGNVLLVPANQAKSLAIKLVDYDGMWVPTAALLKPMELGHPAFQHPQRQRDGIYNPNVDRFSHLVIYTALRALIVSGRPLWERFDNGDNLLFQPGDFQSPAESALFHELLKSSDLGVQRLAHALRKACQCSLYEVPWLNDLAGKRHSVIAPFGPSPAPAPTEAPNWLQSANKPLPETPVSQRIEQLKEANRKQRRIVWTAATVVLLAACGGALVYIWPTPQLSLNPIANQRTTEGEELRVQLHLNRPENWKGKVQLKVVNGPGRVQQFSRRWWFAWTPGELDGGTTPNVTIQLIVAADPVLRDEKTFSIVVDEQNDPPEVQPIDNKFVAHDGLLRFQVVAQDTDKPSLPLSYSIVGEYAVGAEIDNQGFFTYRPSESDAGKSFDVTVKVSEVGIHDSYTRRHFRLSVLKLERGLLASFFSGTNLDRSRHIETKIVDEQIDWHFENSAWEPDKPIPFGVSGIPKDQFSIRYNGFLTPPTPGRYSFFVESNDGVRVFVDEQLIIDKWIAQMPSRHSDEIDLEDRPHSLRIEYVENFGEARLHVRWKRPSASSYELIPATAFFHNAIGGNALRFDVPDNVITPFQYDGKHTITIEARVTPDDSSFEGRPWKMVVGNGQHHGTSIRLANEDGQLFWTFNTHGKLARSDEPAVRGREVHIAGVCDHNELRLYIDGERQRATPKPAGEGHVSKSPFTIATDSKFDHYFSGVIDEVRISNVARYEVDFVPRRRFETDKSTELLLHFDEGQGTEARDSSLHGRHSEIRGAKWIPASTPGDIDFRP